MSRLGFVRSTSQTCPLPEEPDDYRILSNGKGGHLHLAKSVDDWLVPGKNPFGLYLYLENVDALAVVFRDELQGKCGPKISHGNVRICLSDPDETLVRIGWRPPKPRPELSLAAQRSLRHRLRVATIPPGYSSDQYRSSQ